MSSDDEVLAAIKHAGQIRLQALCEALGLPYVQFPLPYRYTPEALGRQLQRLRKAGLIDAVQGQRWEVRER